MKKLTKVIILVITFSYALNLTTQWMFGKNRLVKKVIHDTHTSYKEFQWTEDVNIISDLDFDESQLVIFRDFYSGTKADLNYLKIEEMQKSKILDKKNMYFHLIFVDRSIGSPLYNVEESEKIDEYYHGYRRTYLWILIDWIQIDEMFLGIS
ncbi:hypothetical protein [Catalinimonas niigatensis]|uniref:hypothetical protein n=1 Tax=Catalinimonas niigatensis TaxID=1397264 RepID=UPI002664EAC8|nr:hypothetical protein [Catalinimonas niigatensis]WPP51112.1 hypothetical protein PZB72_01725 [Catalinimonas niigatensis]